MAGNLTRHSVGLTPAHVELIRMLAGIAVENYLADVEADENDQEEAAR
jgi:hypothetical protein